MSEEEWEELQKYYSMNRGAGLLESDLNRFMKKGMSREEAIHYLHEKIFTRHQGLSKRSLIAIAIIIVVVAAIPGYYFANSIINKPIAGNPSETLIGMEYETWFGPKVNDWSGREATPILGLYNSTNTTVISREAEWLTWAGVNFIIIDWSNNVGGNWKNGVAWYIINATSDLLEVYRNMSLHGITVPKITILLSYAPDTPATESNAEFEANWIFAHYINNASYKSLWLYYLGKPLILVYTMGPNVYDPHNWENPNFTVRYMSAFLWQGNPDNDWSWIDGLPPVVVYQGRYPEAVTVTVAWSYYAEPCLGRNNGATYIQYWKTAFKVAPRFIIINQWNEFAKPDQTDVEYSNDIEPTLPHSTDGAGSQVEGWGFYYLVLTKALIDLYRGETPNATIMAISNPVNGSLVTGNYLKLSWTYVGKKPDNFTILLNGKILADGIQGTPYFIYNSPNCVNDKLLSYNMKLQGLPSGYYEVTIIANGAKSYFNLTDAYASLVNESVSGIPCESSAKFFYNGSS